jgi:esterase/lipase superfamily enzyme
MDEVFIYVHGVGNSFEDAVDRTAEIWHYTGRQFVPICYTWPSESRFGLFPYNRDRESSEFTALHFHILLRALSLDPRIKRVNVVAHSRGTFVVMSAISSINAEFFWGAGKDVREMFKLHTVLLAAPDIDTHVFREQFFAQLGISASDRFIMYFSPDDFAVGLSTWLMGGERLGRLKLNNFGPQIRTILEEVPSIEVIDCRLTNTSSHSYAFEHPSAFSDVILVLRDDAYAGTTERPLEEPDPSMWRMTDAYLRPWGWPRPRIHP